MSSFYTTSFLLPLTFYTFSFPSFYLLVFSPPLSSTFPIYHLSPVLHSLSLFPPFPFPTLSNFFSPSSHFPTSLISSIFSLFSPISSLSDSINFLSVRYLVISWFFLLSTIWILSFYLKETCGCHFRAVYIQGFYYVRVTELLLSLI